MPDPATALLSDDNGIKFDDVDGAYENTSACEGECCGAICTCETLSTPPVAGDFPCGNLVFQYDVTITNQYQVFNSVTDCSGTPDEDYSVTETVRVTATAPCAYQGNGADLFPVNIDFDSVQKEWQVTYAVVLGDVNVKSSGGPAGIYSDTSWICTPDGSGGSTRERNINVSVAEV